MGHSSGGTSIREYHGLQEGVWEVEKEAGIEGVEGQETSLAQRIRLALGQAHEAQQEGNSALAAQHRARYERAIQRRVKRKGPVKDCGGRQDQQPTSEKW